MDRNDSAVVIAQIVHISFKGVWFSVYPRVIQVRHPVESQDRNIALPGLLNRPDKIVVCPIRT